MDVPPIIPLDQVDDPRLSVFADLRHAGARQCGEFFVAEGRLIVERLIASDYPVTAILVQRGGEDVYASRLPEDVPVYSLPRDRIKDLVGFDFHRGVIACGRRSPAMPFEHFVDHGCPSISLGLLGITEQENLGNILRTAAALGIHHILLGPGTVDPFSRRVLRVSMATVLKHNFYRLDDPARQLSELRDRLNVRTIASTLEADATPIDDFKHDDRKMVLLLGHEADGIDLEIQRSATDRITIPMQMGVDSLNVSIATAILIYELTRSVGRS